MDDITIAMSEPLLPELAKCLTTTKFGFQLLAHPLVHQLMPINGYANRMLVHKQTCIIEAIRDKNWSAYVFLHERPYRTEALATVATMVTRRYYRSRKFGGLCAQVWMDCENIAQVWPYWHGLFRTVPGNSWMTPKEQAAVNKFPNTMLVYRGECDDGGVSWTTDLKTAKFFARRGINGSTGRVLMAEVFNHEIYAYLTGRGESEVLIQLDSRDSVIARATVLEG